MRCIVQCLDNNHQELDAQVGALTFRSAAAPITILRNELQGLTELQTIDAALFASLRDGLLRLTIFLLITFANKGFVV